MKIKNLPVAITLTLAVLVVPKPAQASPISNAINTVRGWWEEAQSVVEDAESEVEEIEEEIASEVEGATGKFESVLNDIIEEEKGILDFDPTAAESVIIEDNWGNETTPYSARDESERLVRETTEARVGATLGEEGQQRQAEKLETIDATVQEMAEIGRAGEEASSSQQLLRLSVAANARTGQQLADLQQGQLREQRDRAHQLFQQTQTNEHLAREERQENLERSSALGQAWQSTTTNMLLPTPEE